MTIKIERTSLRTLMIGLVGFLVLFGILTLVFTAQYFRSAAFAAQTKSLTEVVRVSSDEVLRQLDAQLFSLGTELQSRAEFREAFTQYLNGGTTDPLQAELDTPFKVGFSAVRTIDLTKLRIYDTHLQLVLESHSQVALPPNLPPEILAIASRRTGAERFKALGSLWSQNHGAYYSVLIPIGGLALKGYLEVIAAPAFNLRAIEKMTQMPLSIYSDDGSLLYRGNATSAGNKGDMLPLEYSLQDGSGNQILRLVSLSDVAQLNADLRQTTLFAVVGVVLLIGFSGMLALAILNRFVFLPVDAMKRDMAHCANGDLSVTVGRRMLQEFSVLADAFNAMASQLATKIEELNRLSRYDSLTGLANRRLFDQRIEDEWRRAQRSKESLSLLMIDVDNFKMFNDFYGHQGGDDCLHTIGDVLRQVVQRSSDLPARYGGEEFAVVLPNTPLSNAVKLGEEILRVLESLNLPHAPSPLGRVSVSIGIGTCCTDKDCSPSGLIKSADGALYEAKRAGRNRIATAGTTECGECSDCGASDCAQLSGDLATTQRPQPQ